MKRWYVFLAVLGLAWLGVTGVLRAAMPQAIVLDGVRDTAYTALSVDAAGDLAPGLPAWSDALTLSVAYEADALFVYVDLPAYAQATSGGEIGLTIEKTGDVPGSGGSSDPWMRAITFAYTSTHNNLGETPLPTQYTLLPDAVVRGNIPGTPGGTYNGWTELRLWTGTGWTSGGTNWGGISGGGKIGSRIAYADGKGVEIKLPYNEVGLTPGQTVHLQFFTTIKDNAAGAYDTVPADAQASGATGATTLRRLATLTLPGASTTPTPTPPPDGCDSAQVGDGAMITALMYHNSLELAYRQPLGAITPTGRATLTLRTCAHDVEQVELLVWKTGAGAEPSFVYPAQLVHMDGGLAYWQVVVPGPGAVIDQWYQFRVRDGGAQGYYHVADTSNSGPGAWDWSFVDRSWKLATVPAPPADFPVPTWMQDAVIYQIFPDRFRDGDPANNPPPYTAGVRIYGPTTCSGYPHGRGSGPQCVVDGRAWNDPLLNPSWGLDFYGGDLQGIIEKINEGYFNDLGVNTLYLNPIFEASSNHGYDTNDYYTVRAYFSNATDPNAVFDELMAAAQAHGLRVILDAVFNHAGSDSRYLEGYGLNRWPDVGACEALNSPYRSWFTQGSYGTSVCAGGWGWKGWSGFETLAELQENDAVKAFFFRGGSPQSPGGVSVSEFWQRKGIAGWRYDVAQDISPAFFDEMHTYVKGEYGSADTLMLGEVTGGCNWDLYATYVREGRLDSAMNYCFRDWAVAFANGGAPSAFESTLQSFRARFPRSAFYAMMNLISSHDSPRMLYLLGGDKTRLKLAVLLQMTLPGAPSVYYGDEVGLTGGGDPDNRRVYPWTDTGGAPDTSLYATYRSLIGMRNTYPSLRRGDLQTLVVDDAQHLYGYLRALSEEKAFIFLCNRAENSKATLDVSAILPEGSILTDAWSGETFTVQQGILDVEVPGMWGRVLIWRATQPSNRAPYVPASPSPADGAVDVPRHTVLTWQGGDPDGDPVTYTVALGVTQPTVVTFTAQTRFTPTLEPGLSYTWQITASDGISETVGPVWHFTTALRRLYLPLVVRSHP